MTLTPGQRQALRQVEAIAAADPGGLELIRVTDPTDESRDLVLLVSIDCGGFEHRDGGLRLRERERLVIFVPPDFPFSKPSAATPHRRWAGAAHVQWGFSLCLYQAPSVEWIPADGMYGFFDRLGLWLRQAALGELDPAGAPLHPPVAYVTGGTPLIIPRRDTPAVVDKPWIGWADLEHHGDRRIDVGAWKPVKDEHGGWNTPPLGAAAVFLLPTAMDWEYPAHVVGLLVALLERGISYTELMLHLKLSALAVGVDQALFVLVGSAMRGIKGDQPRQHLAAWRIPAAAVADLRAALGEYSRDEAIQHAGEPADERVFEWAKTAKAEWCSVREDRPEIVVRRDEGSPMEAFAGKSVAVWGCGALGAPVAHWLARAGARRLILVDSASVSPGILVRQPFADADIGKRKAEVVADQIRAIRPDIDVVAKVRDLRRLLDQPDWHQDADVVLDCSANLTVQTKLELVRWSHPAPKTALACMLIGHTAQHGIAALARETHSGATADVLRAIKLECLRRPALRDFAEEFWPLTPRRQHFQPEPGCSDATFRGSGAEASALADVLLTDLAHDLQLNESATAVGHVVALPVADHEVAGHARLSFGPSRCAREAEDEYEIRVSPAAMQDLRAWVASAARRLGAGSETGGLIFGQRDDAARVIWVDLLAGPPPDSRESSLEFVCGTDGVEEACRANSELGHGSLEFLGMWHTHPSQASLPSRRDLFGMAALVEAAPSTLAQGLILIVGHSRALVDLPRAVAAADISAYLFDSTVTPDQLTIAVKPAEPLELARPDPPPRDVGLALSGGGARAIAFHLGCFRALHDRGVLERVQVVSGVSGGSIAAALYAYFDDEFESFDARVCELLRRGLQWSIARRTLLSRRILEGVGTRLVAGSAAAAARTVGVAQRKLNLPASAQPPLRRWVSRTDAFADVLQHHLFGQTRMPDIRRPALDVVLNACDLTTGSAFRFGSRESGTWRVGKLVNNDVSVAEAVAASAAYPLLLPALDRRWRFHPLDGGAEMEARVVLTDGGIFDNLGISCLEPGRSQMFSTNVYDVDYIIACDAGRGLLEPEIPFGPMSRLARSFTATFRKAQDGARGRLHLLVEHRQLRGFVMPYLGQRDRALPYIPPDLVTRDLVAGYPTDFAAMSDDDIALLAGRGQQLTRILIERWCPEL